MIQNIKIYYLWTKFSSLILDIVFEYFNCGTVKHKKWVRS